MDKELKTLTDRARIDHFNVQALTTSHDLEKLRLKAQNRKHWSNGVEAITNANIQNWRIREIKKPRYNPQPEQATGGEREQHDVRGGGGGSKE